MRYPGYLLNPGDLFQVEPERVMHATGAPKDEKQRSRGRRIAKNRKASKAAAEQKEREASEAEVEAKGKEEQAVKSQTEESTQTEEKKDENPKEALKHLLDQSKAIMSSTALPTERRVQLRGFRAAVRRVLSRSESSTILKGNIESQFAELISLLKAKKVGGKEQKNKRAEAAAARESSDEVTKAADNTPADNKPSEALTEAFQKAAHNGQELEEDSTSQLSDEEFAVLRRALTELRENPIDPRKPYATPWRPRDFMSPFAFIPRYLEVNQNICAAVYVRHPVARPGYSEVPTPFTEETGTHAFTWYLRRR